MILTDHRHSLYPRFHGPLCLIFKAGKTGNKIFSGVEFFSLLLKEHRLKNSTFILVFIDSDSYSWRFKLGVGGARGFVSNPIYVMLATVLVCGFQTRVTE